MQLLATLANGDRQAKVYKDTSQNPVEYVVKFFTAGVHHYDEVYYTGDYDDATGTAKQAIQATTSPSQAVSAS